MVEQIEVCWSRIRAAAGYFLMICISLSVLAIVVTHVFGGGFDPTQPWGSGGYAFRPEARAAPAPFGHKERYGREKEVLGEWTLQWYGTPYHYALKPNGSYTHERSESRPQDRVDFSGTWRIEGGDLVIDEYMADKYLMTHRMRKDGDWWVSTTNVTTKLVRTP